MTSSLGMKSTFGLPYMLRRAKNYTEAEQGMIVFCDVYGALSMDALRIAIWAIEFIMQDWPAPSNPNRLIASAILSVYYNKVRELTLN
jgi:hypothetical protein